MSGVESEPAVPGPGMPGDGSGARPASDGVHGAEPSTAAGTSGPQLRNRVRGMRDHLVADPRFRRFAARFPTSRLYARRQARALFDIVAGFVYSQVLLACVRLKVFDHLHRRPLTGEELARRLGLPKSSAMRLFEAAAGIGLLDKRGSGRFGLGALGATLVGNPALTAMIEHHTMLYDDLRDPVALVKRDGNSGGAAQGTALSKYWAYSGAERPGELGADRVADYSALMAASQEMVADEVLDAYPDLHRHRCLLDVGGGDGAFLAAAAKLAPRLRLMLFDLPSVAERAKQRFEREGLASRASVVGGDFHTDPLPRGADLVTLVRVIHDHDDKQALALLRAVRQALPPGGVVLVAEPMAGTSGEGRMEAYFALYLLAMGSGRPRTAEEIFGLLSEAGFERPRVLSTHTPMVVRVISAQVPGAGRP